MRGGAVPSTIRDRALEDAADDAFLPPDLSRRELAVSGQARELGARPGAAGGTVVGLAGAEHEVLAVGARRGRPEELDVIDLAAVRARDALRGEAWRIRQVDLGQAFDVSQLKRLAVVGTRKNQLPPRPHRRHSPRPGTSTVTPLAER